MSQSFQHPNPKCEQVAENLPWFLNGTLDEQTTEAVVEHLAACAHCSRVLEETVEASSVMTAHLDTLTLAEYAFGLPTETPVELIESHLSQCAQCRQELAMVQMDSDMEEDDDHGAVSTGENVLEFTPRRSTRQSEDAPSDWNRSSHWSRWAAAAGLAAAIGGSLIVGQVTNPGEEILVENGEAFSQKNTQVKGEESGAVEILFSDGFESGDLGSWASET